MNSLPERQERTGARALLFILLILATLYSANALALDPNEILVVANDNSQESVSLADFYIKRRGVPKENLFHVRCTTKETVSRRAFERDIAAPLKKVLSTPPFSGRIKCILLTYGIPLRILGEDRSTLGKNREKQSAREAVGSQKAAGKASANPKAAFTSSASVDSELMTLKLYGSYNLSGWLPNPLYLWAKPKGKSSLPSNKILMVSRIDGPDLKTAKRIIDDAVQAEKNGLDGRACLDCRYTSQQRKTSRDAYHLFDNWIYQAGLFLKSRGLPVSINQGPELFKKGECDNCALYCGWYSLAKYIEGPSWKKGAIGYHVASRECASLHGKNSQWCRMILKKGACATLGPVAEPFVQAFPPPNLFFRLLVDNGLCVARAYLLSSPMLSWQMVLVGDPLYRPFLRRPGLNDSPGLGRETKTIFFGFFKAGKLAIAKPYQKSVKIISN